MRVRRSPFRSLRWKLTVSYMAITVGALLAVTLAVTVLVFSFVFPPTDFSSPAFWIGITNDRLTPALAFALTSEPVNTEAVAMLLANVQPALSGFDLLTVGFEQLHVRTMAQLDVLILARDETLLGITPGLKAYDGSIGEHFDAERIPGLSGPLQAALAAESDPERLANTRSPDYDLLVAVPVFDNRQDEMHGYSRQVVGVVALVFESLPTRIDIPAYTWRLISRSLLVFLIAAGGMAAIFGFLTARGLASRFDRLSMAADAWSQGHFTQFVDDPADDELAELAERLNLMAKHLQQLLDERQEIAVYEERSRLARDLHDAVTQTLFSASLIAEALPALWQTDQEDAKELLLDLQRLNRGAMAEMRTLLMELRPASLAEANLGDLLRQLGEAFAGRMGVPVKVQIDSCVEPADQVPSLPVDVHVSLYRIAQESLNNVAKHASASNVEINVYCTHTHGKEGPARAVVMYICDDGRGFDPKQISPERLGLGIIKERADAIGAKLQIESQPGEGTQILLVWIGTDGSVESVPYPGN